MIYNIKHFLFPVTLKKNAYLIAMFLRMISTYFIAFISHIIGKVTNRYKNTKYLPCGISQMAYQAHLWKGF